MRTTPHQPPTDYDGHKIECKTRIPISVDRAMREYAAKHNLTLSATHELALRQLMEEAEKGK
jgi:hypothetical protein